MAGPYLSFPSKKKMTQYAPGRDPRLLLSLPFFWVGFCSVSFQPSITDDVAPAANISISGAQNNWDLLVMQIILWLFGLKASDSIWCTGLSVSKAFRFGSACFKYSIRFLNLYRIYKLLKYIQFSITVRCCQCRI